MFILADDKFSDLCNLDASSRCLYHEIFRKGTYFFSLQRLVLFKKIIIKSKNIAQTF